MSQLMTLARRVVRKATHRRMTSQVGRGPINVIDVGSFGEMPWPWTENAKQIGRMLLFDPLEAEPKVNQDRSPITVYSAAIWDRAEDRDFFVHGFAGSGSSLFSQNVDYVRENFDSLHVRGPRELAETWFARSKVKSVHRVQCRTLDSVLAELNHPFPYHFLKIDTQGAESRVIAGAEDYLRRDCLAVHLELFTIPLYAGIKLQPEVTRQLEDLGFELALEFPPHGSFDSQHDCLFLKRGVENEIVATIKSMYQLDSVKQTELRRVS